MRWGRELARVEAWVGRAGTPPDERDVLEVALVKTAGGSVRKRIRVNGVAVSESAVTFGSSSPASCSVKNWLIGLSSLNARIT